VQCKVLAVLEAMVTASPGGWLRRDGDVVTVLREGLEQRLVEDARVGAANPQNARQMLLHAINGFWAPHEGTTKVSFGKGAQMRRTEKQLPPNVLLIQALGEERSRAKHLAAAGALGVPRCVFRALRLNSRAQTELSPPVRV